MIPISNLISTVINSFLVGSLYAVLGLGLTLSINATKMYNWAYAELVTIGAYVVSVLTTFQHMSLLPSLILAIALSAGVALVMDEVVFKPLVSRGSSPIQLMLGSIAVGIFIRYGIFIYAATAFLLTLKANIAVLTVATIAGAQLTSLLLWIVPTSLGMVVVLRLLLSKTMFGKQVRAMSDNPNLARSSGIDVVMMRRYVWLIVGAIAGLAGSFWAMYSFITPEIGWLLLLDAFAAAIVGGLTYSGTVIAATCLASQRTWELIY